MAEIQKIKLNASEGENGYATLQGLIAALFAAGNIDPVGENPERQTLIDILRNSSPAERALAGVEEQEEEEAGLLAGAAYIEVAGGDADFAVRIAGLEASLVATQRSLAASQHLNEILMSESNVVKLSSVRTFDFLSDLFPPKLLAAIDDEQDENMKRLMLSTLSAKKTMQGLHSVATMEAVKRNLPVISEDQLKAIITGDFAKFSIGSILDQSPLSKSLPPIDKNSTRYQACMGVMIGYTEMFFSGYAAKLRSFVDKFIAKESSAQSWAVMWEMELSYRQVVSS
jgi:hypothetical protein